MDAESMTATGERAAAPASRPPATPTMVRRRRRRRDLAVVVAAVWLTLIVLAAIFADLLPIPAPDAISSQFSLAPGLRLENPLGTDTLGRDQLARVIYGARVSLAVAIGATLLALTAGTVLGMVAGYLRGLTDSVFEIGTNVLLAFPPLIFLIALAAVTPPSILTLVVGLAIIGVPTFARIARANTIAFANREFVTASTAMGATNIRVLTRDILPNVMLPVTSFALLVAAALVVAEGSLSFLGLGVPPPAPSWGGMIAAARDQLADHPHLVAVPGGFFFLTVFSLNSLGDYARGKVGKETAL
ncbi:ABC transporter permease [Acrocarpospora catenulata]|uniref:ABC transporter permease n=1 Tax=Acrocarpospora catenulata TaxID=2836182 RepID=UPI001BDA234D|nr:ABC transporter permease [Acrocarpospora catenulata]